MGEREEVVAELRAAGVLDGVRWAFDSAVERVLDDYSEAAGHDAAWFGITRFVLLRDRLDRAFACRRYVVPEEADASLSLDVLHAELSEAGAASMPRLQSGAVRRADLNGSPGWRYGRWRLLLASSAFGAVTELSWVRKSPTKRRVADRYVVSPDQQTLFDAVNPGDPASEGGPAVVALPPDDGLETLVVGHSLDPNGLGAELVLGRPRLNVGGGNAWHWMHDLLAGPPLMGGRDSNTRPDPIGPSPVPDARVSLRRQAGGRTDSAPGVGA